MRPLLLLRWPAATKPWHPAWGPEDLQKKQDRTTQFDLSNPFMAAGGGIAKEAGDSSGPPPEKGPMSQGLLSLKNRVRNL